MEQKKQLETCCEPHVSGTFLIIEESHQKNGHLSLVLLWDVVPAGVGRVILAVGRQASTDPHAAAVELSNNPRVSWWVVGSQRLPAVAGRDELHI